MTELIQEQLAGLFNKPVVEYESGIHQSPDFNWAAQKPILYRELWTDGTRIAAVDMGAGRDLFYDGVAWHYAKHGIFLKDWVFVTDYYGYPDGGVFKKVGGGK